MSKRYNYHAEGIFNDEVLKKFKATNYEHRSFGVPTTEENAQNIATLICLCISLHDKVDKLIRDSLPY